MLYSVIVWRMDHHIFALEAKLFRSMLESSSSNFSISSLIVMEPGQYWYHELERTADSLPNAHRQQSVR